MGGTARSSSHLPEKSDCRIRQFARTDIGKHFFFIYSQITKPVVLHLHMEFLLTVLKALKSCT